MVIHLVEKLTYILNYNKIKTKHAYTHTYTHLHSYASLCQQVLLKCIIHDIIGVILITLFIFALFYIMIIKFVSRLCDFSFHLISHFHSGDESLQTGFCICCSYNNRYTALQ